LSSFSPISNIRLPDIAQPEAPSLTGDAASPGEFQSMLANAIGGVERLSGNADQATQRFLTGEGEDVHTVALATQRAGLAFEMFIQVRNKVVSAYQSVMQMQV
jgi:flagellar hook-basal body complex protein FliE